MFKLKIHWQILIALILSVPFGFFFPQYVDYVSWLGDLFLRALKMIIVPLILTSIVSGVTNIGDAQNLGKLGLKTILYYVSTSLLAIMVGLTFVNLLQPGVGADLNFNKNIGELGLVSDTLGNVLLRMIPANIFEALVSADMLAIIFFSILLGFFITKIADEYKNTLIILFNSGFELMMKLTSFIIKFTPLGIFGIVAFVVA
jgi:Na+/H+-dicarboxylate symporter